MDETKQLIQNIFNLDQQLRKQKIWSVQSSLDFNEVTTTLLKEIVANFGIPVPSLVGQETADMFSLLLSHCTDLNFVENILKDPKFMEAPFSKDKIAIAYDNLLVKSGKKQCFGSVLNIVEKDDGSFESVPVEIEDAQNVENRRKAFGLTITLEEYIKNAHDVLKKIKR